MAHHPDLLRGKPLILGNAPEEVWAHRDVNFESRRGETVGIIEPAPGE